MPAIHKPRIILNNCENDLRAFESYAACAKTLADDFDVRVVINHLHRPHWEEWPDRDDPYPLYFIGSPTLRDFALHPALKTVQDAAFIRGNQRLMRAKAAILEKHGLRGAFGALEPIYLRETFLRKFPAWRGPRVDHPRRSREPLFAPCLHRPEVQEVYAEMAATLVRDCPVIDTFYIHVTNDSGAGFCHYAGAYFGPNGPEACRSAGAATAVAAFHRALLDGARRGGARSPLTLMSNAGRAWQPELIPQGAHHLPSAAKVPDTAGLDAGFAHAYPVRYLTDPLHVIEQTAAVPQKSCAVLSVWLCDAYSRAPADIASVRRLVRLIRAVWRDPARAAGPLRRLSLLEAHLAEEFGAAAAPRALEAFVALNGVFRLLADNPMRLRAYLPLYGSVSHRWLTRPLVALPETLAPAEEREVLTHVFSAFGPEGRRNLLDLHGKLAINPAGDYDQYSKGIDVVVHGLEEARGQFEAAARAVGKRAAARTLALSGKAARVLALLWRNCRNTLEFAALRDNALVAPDAHRAAPVDKGGADLGWISAYHKVLYRVLRSELDVVDALVPLVRNDAERVIARAEKAINEDSLLLGPDLAAQLDRKRATMLRHWQDVLRLEPLKERPFTFTYW
jgi:hypothetical protein